MFVVVERRVLKTFVFIICDVPTSGVVLNGSYYGKIVEDAGERAKNLR